MLALTLLLGFVVFRFVNLSPVVDENFFSSGNDAAFREAQKLIANFRPILKSFSTFSAASAPTATFGRIAKLTRRLQEIDAVSTVKSVALGPKSVQGAIASPFWHRLLIARDGKSTNVIAFVRAKDAGPTMRRIEQIVHEMDAPNFHIHIAGSPMSWKASGQSLAHDFRYLA